MKTTMDKGGRVMVPSTMRRALGLRAGQRFTVRRVGDHIELHPDEPTVRMEIAGDGVPLLISDEPAGGTITLDETIESIHAAREERMQQMLEDPGPRLA
ncbi:MAG: AbrB/MazE/SpoVT family DNA-binding domain-containing protein [Candidatus Dormiibacterota bacterium]